MATNTTFSVDGHGIFDNHDYNLTLGLKKEENYFLRFNFENFRTYYNGDGGFYPPADLQYSRSGNALALDRGEISFEGGLMFKDKPSVTFKYSHLYRDGEKSSTIWGQTHPQLIFPSVGLTPTFYDIDEKRDIFELNAKHHYKATEFGGGVRYELGDLNNALKISRYPGEPPVGGAPQDATVTALRRRGHPGSAHRSGADRGCGGWAGCGDDISDRRPILRCPRLVCPEGDERALRSRPGDESTAQPFNRSAAGGAVAT